MQSEQETQPATCGECRIRVNSDFTDGVVVLCPMHAQAKALLEAAQPFAELGSDLTHQSCHEGIVPVERCYRCSMVFTLREAIAAAKGETG